MDWTHFSKVIDDPEHPEHEDMLTWVGEDFDPEDFDIAETNERLAWIRNRFM